jgi:hypothetical protein
MTFRFISRFLLCLHDKNGAYADKLLEIHSPKAETLKNPEPSWNFEGAVRSLFFPFQNFRDRDDPWHAFATSGRLIRRALPVDMTAALLRKSSLKSKEN